MTKMTIMIIRSYRELMQIPDFEGRYEYLKMKTKIGDKTFGFERFLNQSFYRSKEWKDVRREVIRRDNGCDLAMEDRDIRGRIEIHHINPISIKDVEEHSDKLLDPENLICVSPETHKAIHYGDASLLTRNEIVVRKPYDTCPWRT